MLDIFRPIVRRAEHALVADMQPAHSRSLSSRPSATQINGVHAGDSWCPNPVDRLALACFSLELYQEATPIAVEAGRVQLE